jgi:hypothetical protein
MRGVLGLNHDHEGDQTAWYLLQSGREGLESKGGGIPSHCVQRSEVGPRNSIAPS